MHPPEPPPIDFPSDRTCWTITEVGRLLGLHGNWRNLVLMVARQDPPVPFECASKTKLYNRRAVLQIQERFIAFRRAIHPDKPLPWDVPAPSPRPPRRKSKRDGRPIAKT